MSHRKPPPSNLADVSGLPLRGDAPVDRQATSIISQHRGDLLSINHYRGCRGQFTLPLDPRRLAASAALCWPGSEAGRGATFQLYTSEERKRRDASPWTIVQAVLAPVQFLIFLVSFGLVIRYLVTGDGLPLATASVVLKTIALYAIMVTGSIWEREVFGRYLFARPFFWEDVFSILVLALHTIYLVALVFDALSSRDLMLIALAAYATYVINATQFVLKLRAARREQPAREQPTAVPGTLGIAS